MGADSSDVRGRALQPETAALIEHFRTAMQAAPASALASLYTYESRVPAVARTKAEGLKQHYGADMATSRYFALHQVADVYHAKVWRDAIEPELTAHLEQADAALDAAEVTAAALWKTLSGIERERQQARMTAA